MADLGKAVLPLAAIAIVAAAAAGGKKRGRGGKVELGDPDIDWGGDGGGGDGDPDGRPLPTPDDPWVPDDGFTELPAPVSEPVLFRFDQGAAALARREEDRRNQGKENWRLSNGDRAMDVVGGVVLHQMGFSRGDDPSRYDGITSHFNILPNGQITQTHPENEYLKASHGFNRYTVSVEFAGNLPDTKGNWWKPEKMGQDYLTEEQVMAGRWLIDYLIAVFPQTGSPGLSHVFAHRQAGGQDRGNDPGPDIWYNVAEWAIKNRGMEDGGPGYTIGDGLTVPDKWRYPSGNLIS